MLSTMMQFPLTLTSILERAGRLFGPVEIVSRLPDRSLRRSTYADLARRSRLLAGALDAAGVGPGERVATLMWNDAWHLEAYFGIPASGRVVHTLNPRLHPDDLAYIIKEAGDTLLIVSDSLLPVYEKLRARAPVERVLVVPTTGQPVPAGCEDYEKFLERGSEGYRFPQLNEYDAAMICYTSGTTGTTGVPKGVVYSHRALVLHSFCIALPDVFALSQTGCVLPVVPMFHVNAWGIPYAATMVGMKQVLPGPHLDAASLLELLESEGVTRTAGVPTVWFGVLDLLERQPGRWKLPPDLLAVVGGAALPQAMVQTFDRLGIAVRQAWGMTELTPVGTVSIPRSYMADWPAEQRLAIRAKQGSQVPFMEIRAMSGDREVPWDGESMGELQVRGPWVAAGYFSHTGNMQCWTGGGWFRTGDVVTIDPDGYVKITDRTKDLIKSGGEWISSVDLENALVGHPPVREAAVIAVPHPRWQERPLAAVVLKDGCTATAEELRAHLAASFSSWQLPDAFVFVPEIPRTSVGKMQKSRLRETFAGWQWTGAARGAE